MAEQLTVKIIQVTFSLGTTINLGNFENLRVDLSATAQVPEGLNLQKATHELAAYVRDELLAQLKVVEPNAHFNAIAALRDVGTEANNDDIAF